MYKRHLKRTLDLIVSLFGCILLCPLFFILVITSIFVYRGKVFFRQQRLGYGHTVFTIYKMRTMLDLYDEQGRLLPDSSRINGYGQFLRKHSLDELPQLFNIIKGDISLVGPRPLLVEYLGLLSSSELLRHTVRPGLTGLAQIKGRNSLLWSQRFEYDAYYVDNQSIVLDVKIIMSTFFQLIKGQDLCFSTSLIDERRNQPGLIDTNPGN